MKKQLTKWRLAPITLAQLEEHSACSDAIEWFRKKFHPKSNRTEIPAKKVLVAVVDGEMPPSWVSWYLEMAETENLITTVKAKGHSELDRLRNEVAQAAKLKNANAICNRLSEIEAAIEDGDYEENGGCYDEWCLTEAVDSKAFLKQRLV